MNKKLLFGIIFGVILIGIGVFILSAKNIATYDAEERTMIIRENLLSNNIVAKISLKSEPNVYVIRGKDRLVAEFEVDSFEKDYNTLFEKMEFYDIESNMKKFEREFTYKYKQFYEEEVNDYEIVCKEREVWNATTEINDLEKYDCTESLIGSHIEQEFNWVDLNDKERLPEGKLIIGIFTDVKAGDNVEWIPTILSTRISQWAVWTESLNANLMAYWGFNENTGTLVKDLSPTPSGYENLNLTVTGGNWDATGINGSCYFPDSDEGVNSYVDLDGQSDATINMWIYTAEAPTDAHAPYWDIGNADNKNGEIMFYSNSPNIIVNYWTNGSSEFSTMSQKIGSWEMLTVTFSNTLGTTYRNGTLAVVTGNNPQGLVDWHFDFGDCDTGGINLFSSCYLDGNWKMDHVKFDEMMIWNRTLSASEILNLYDGGAGTFYSGIVQIPPNVIINSPANSTYNIPINFTVNATDGSGISNCWVTLNAGVSNITLENLVGDIYNYTAPAVYSDGGYLAEFYCNDTGGSINGTETVSFTVDTINPDINITYPINLSYFRFNTVDVNYTYNDTNIDSCWYSNGTYEFNTSLTSCGTNITDVIWADGEHNVTIWVNDSAGNENFSIVTFIVDVLPPVITIVSPANNTNTSNINLDINYTAVDIVGVGSCWWANDSMLVNHSLANCGINITDIVWSEGSHNVTIWANDTSGNENSSSVSFRIDTTPPEVNVTAPIFVDYQLTSRNLTVNWTVSDGSSCWGSFDGGINNISLTCTDQNISRNITSVNNDTFTFWANDTLGNVGNTSRTWIYRIFEVQQTFSATTIGGSTETFVNNIFLGSGETIAVINLNYNGTDKSASYFNVGGNEYNLSSTFIIPPVASATNISFFWKIDLVSKQINTSIKNQSIQVIAIDDCSTYSTLLFNYTLIDEETQGLISNVSANATVLELDIKIYDSSKTILILNLSQKYEDINPVRVCSNINLTEATVYSVDSTVRYSAANYSIEYYNIQNMMIKNSTIPQNINLFDLKIADTTEFQITFKDSNFVTVEDALVQINRQYLSEGVFKTVEIPKTDSNGQTVAHLVEKAIVYNIIVLKEGEILGTFNNVIAFCEDILIGSCFISLNALVRGEVSFDYDDEIELFYNFDYNETSRNLIFDFTTTDGSVKNITLSAIKFDQLGNTSVCDGFLISSGGSIYCPVPISVGNESIIVSIFVDGDLKITNYIQAGREFDIGDSGYFLMFFLVLSLALMMTQSKTGVIIGVILGFISGVLLSFIQGGLMGIGSSIIWLIIMGVILIYKLNSQGQT